MKKSSSRLILLTAAQIEVERNVKVISGSLNWGCAMQMNPGVLQLRFLIDYGLSRILYGR